MAMAQGNKIRGVWMFGAVGAAALLLAHWGDGWAYRTWWMAGVYDTPLGQALRSVGYLPVWLVMAVGLALQSWPRVKTEGWRQALAATILLPLAVIGNGVLAEVLKILIRRERPNMHGGAYVFRPWTDNFLATGNLGMPSSHTAVAFAAAFLLLRFYPRVWPVWLGLAAGCAITRVMDRAHFLSDVTLGAVSAYAVVWLLMLTQPHRGMEI